MTLKCAVSVFLGLVVLCVPLSAAPRSRFCTYGKLKDEAEAFIVGKEQYLDYKPKPLPPRSCDANPLQGLECDACLVAVEALKIYSETGRSKKEIVELATRICIVFKIEDKRVCTDIVQEFKVIG